MLELDLHDRWDVNVARAPSARCPVFVFRLGLAVAPPQQEHGVDLVIRERNTAPHEAGTPAADLHARASRARSRRRLS